MPRTHWPKHISMANRRSYVGKGNPAYKHGKVRTSTYESWKGMRGRCLCKTSQDYADYGGRGISVCERWNTFVNFFADMGTCPKGRSLGRIDNNGNYTPENCEWQTATQQSRNRRKPSHFKRGSEHGHYGRAILESTKKKMSISRNKYLRKQEKLEWLKIREQEMLRKLWLAGIHG